MLRLLCVSLIYYQRVKNVGEISTNGRTMEYYVVIVEMYSFALRGKKVSKQIAVLLFLPLIHE